MIQYCRCYSYSPLSYTQTHLSAYRDCQDLITLQKASWLAVQAAKPNKTSEISLGVWPLANA